MKIALLADIHANVPALDRVLWHARSKNVEKYLLLGDQIGYLANPRETLETLNKLMARRDVRWICGNHEELFYKMMKGNIEIQTDIFAQAKDLEDKKTYKSTKLEAVQAMLLQINEIRDTDVGQNYFKEIEQRINAPILDDEDLLLTHGTLSSPLTCYLNPGSTEYSIKTHMTNLLNGKAEQPYVIAFGHTHIPTLISVGQDGTCHNIDIKYGECLPLGHGALINPGSVGLPRDGDQRASYAIYESENRSVFFYRLDYLYPKIKKDMGDKKYPKKLLDELDNPCIPDDLPGIVIANLITRSRQPGE